MRFAKRAFFWGGIYGLVAVTPLYFMKSLMGRWFPPAIEHPEYYFGFVGAVVVWHVAFLVISKDPARYRALMPVAVLEKIAFGAPVLALCALGKTAPPLAVPAAVDLILGMLFLISYLKTAETPAATRVPAVAAS